jgi:hypothetical protein
LTSGKKTPAADSARQTVMAQDREFSVPHEIDEILERLPAQVTLNVPDHVLAIWFPPGPAAGSMDEVALTRAQTYAQSCGCKFAYHRTVREGIFYRPLASAK